MRTCNLLLNLCLLSCLTNFDFIFGKYRGIDHAIANNEVPLRARDLPQLLYQASCDLLLVTPSVRKYSLNRGSI